MMQHFIKLYRVPLGLTLLSSEFRALGLRVEGSGLGLRVGVFALGV